MWTKNFQIVQAGFRKVRGTRDQFANIRWIIKKAREFQKNTYIYFIDYTKDFDCVDQTNCGKFFKRWEYQTTWPASWEICMQVRKQQLELDMEQQMVPNRERPCLFYLYAEYLMRNTGLDEVQLESRSPGEKSDMYREGNGTSLQYSCLENPMDGGAW